MVRNEIRTTIERIASDIQAKTLEGGINEYARLMYGIIFDLRRDGQITEDEFKEVLTEFDKGNIEYCPEWFTQRIEEIKKHGH